MLESYLFFWELQFENIFLFQVIERMFYVSTEKERSEWVDAIKTVANSLNEQDQQRGQIEDIEMGSIAEDELLDEKFSLQGTSTGKISGKKKVVSGSSIDSYDVSVDFMLIFWCLVSLIDSGELWILESSRQGHIRKSYPVSWENFSQIVCYQNS